MMPAYTNGMTNTKLPLAFWTRTDRFNTYDHAMAYADVFPLDPEDSIAQWAELVGYASDPSSDRPTMPPPPPSPCGASRCVVCPDFYRDNGPCDEGKPMCSPHRKPDGRPGQWPTG